MGCSSSSAKTADHVDGGAGVGVVPDGNSGKLIAVRERQPAEAQSGAPGSRGQSQTQQATLTIHAMDAPPSTSATPQPGMHQHTASFEASAAGSSGGAGGIAVPPSPDMMPNASPDGFTRGSSLMLPSSGRSEADGTASHKLRSSLRNAGSKGRRIPPKASPIAPPTRKLTGQGSSLATLGLLPTPHGSSASADGSGAAGAGVENGGGSHRGSGVGVVGSSFVHNNATPLHQDHAGHHGYGPLAMAAASGAGTGGSGGLADNDASTQLNSDTSVGFASSAAGAAPLGGDSSVAGAGGMGAGMGGGLAGTGSMRRKKIRRQTSHRGLLSKLALQFPLIKASFQRVHTVFQRYHRERIQRELDQNRADAAAADAATADGAGDAAATTTTATTGSAAAAPAPSPSVTFDPSLPACAGTAATASSGGGGGGTASQSSKSSSSRSKPYLTEEISLDKLSEVLRHVSGSSKTFSEEEVRLLFSQADLDGSKTISFREFLIAVSIGFFLVDDGDKEKGGNAAPAAGAGMGVGAGAGDGTTAVSLETPTHSTPASPRHLAQEGAGGSSSPPSPHPQGSNGAGASDLEFFEIRRGFRVVQKAFQDIDEDHSGTVDVSELKKALFATSQSKDPSLLELRFKELDFNGDGGVNFPEFMYGFVSWVGFMEEDE